MPFHAEDYFQVANERVSQAKECCDRRQYVVTHYLAGLAVECLLRAYRVRKETHFDARHDLSLLRKQASFYSFVPKEQLMEVHAAFSHVVTRWSNEDRYRSTNSLKRKLRSANLDRGIRGDFLKENCRIIVNAAITVVSVGGKQWRP